MTLTFSIEDNFVSLSVHQLTVWITIPYYPYLALVAWVLSLLSFKWDKFILSRFLSKGEPWGAKDTGRFFLIFEVMTFLFAALATYFFLAVMTQSCGPHSGTTGGAGLVSFLTSVPGVTQVFSALTNSWLIWTVAILLLMVVLVLTNAEQTLAEVVLDRAQRHQADITMYGGIIRRLRGRVSELASRLREYKDRAADKEL